MSSDPEDALATTSVRSLGADHVIWASDFPHPDAEFPGAVAEFVDERASELTADELDAVFWETPARFYRLEERFTPTA